MKPTACFLAALFAAGPAFGGSRSLAPPSVSAMRNAPVVLALRLTEHPDRTRLVIELSDPVRLRVFTLSGPNRVVVDMPEVLWRLTGPDRPSPKGAVKSYRYGLFRPGDSRVVLDLNAPARPAPAAILPPRNGFGYRAVLDLYPTTQAKFDQTAGWPADSRDGKTAARAAAAAPARKIVVIDAGHGGKDDGATGVDGTKEKDVALAEARQLARALAKRGYAVRLTRDADTYLSLRQRIAIARRDRGDLFISLHADSNPDARLRGASVYTLSQRGSDREAAALARKENSEGPGALGDSKNRDVLRILDDLAAHDTIGRSVRFAKALVSALPRATGVLASAPRRSAAFIVLMTPNVPSVLVELGYLSNAGDCAAMKTQGWRERAANAIAGAVDRQFAREKTASVSVVTGG